MEYCGILITENKSKGVFIMYAQSIFNFILIGFVILGFKYEEQIAKWERKVFASIKKKFIDRKALSRREKFVVISNEHR